jgi:GNAT superfamily N-acetyltransferase
MPRHPDPAPFSLRPAVEGELDDIAALFPAALEPYRGAGCDWILDLYLADLVDIGSRFEAAENFVAVREGRIIGSVAFYPDVVLEGWSNLPAGWAGFRALVVHPCARGAGIGRALVERCLERGRQTGGPTLGIHTIALLSDAVRLYERLGFSRCPEFDLRAADVFEAAGTGDMRVLAFRYDLGSGASRARQPIGPRTVTVPGVTT